MAPLPLGLDYLFKGLRQDLQVKRELRFGQPDSAPSRGG